jgi:hypothetical protein
MGKGGLQVWNPSEKNRLSLMMVVRLKYELIPVVRAQAVFQQLMQPFTVIASLNLKQSPFEKLRPVVLCGFYQDVGSGEEDVNLFQFR